MEKLLIGIIFFTTFSCKSQHLDFVLEESLNKIIEISKETGYSYYDSDFLFVRKEGNIIASFDIDELRRLYFGKHIVGITKNITFEVFIREVLTKEIDLECDKILYCFLLDEKIEKEYLEVGFRRFKERYTKLIYSDNSILLKTSNLTKNQLYSVMYYFYLNAFFTIVDDYGGGYVSKYILDEEIPKSDSLDLILEEL